MSSLQPLEVLRRFLADELLDVDRIDLLQIVRRLHAAQLALEPPPSGWFSSISFIASLHRDVVLAAEVVALAELWVRPSWSSVHRELGHLGLQPLVLHEQARHHLLELAALSRRHAIEERLHLPGLTPELLEQLIEALDAGEVLTPLLLERVEVGLVALGALPQHLVEVTHHLAHPLGPSGPMF
jgi:hypothetical protein